MPERPGTAPEWQPVPGLEGGTVRSFLRRPDVCCSNAFLVAAPGAVLGIDAGADPAQADLIAEEIGRLCADGARPALLVLTHCHVDHAAAAARLRDAGAEVCAHALAAEALEAGDAERTAAFLLGEPGVPVAVDRRLLEGSGRAVLCGAGGVPVAEVHHAPGHSPDGLVVRAGDLLFVGDLLFALDPVVAAVPGFDPVALAGTVRLLRDLLAHGTVAAVMPGHGAPLTAAQASAALDRMETRLAAGTAVVPMTPERVVATRVVAQELLEEADRVFSLLGGRMLALAHHLSALGEEAASAEIEAAFETDVDACLSSFARFAEAHAAGERVDVQLVLKAVQVAGKIGATLGPGRPGGADAALVGRFSRLAEDFLALIETGAPALEAVRVDLARAAAEAASAAVTPPVTDDEVLAAADDEGAFRAVLVRRLAAPPLFAPGGVSLAAGPGEAAALTDPARLGDVLAALLEDLSGAGHRHVAIKVTADGDAVVLVLSGDPEGPPPLGPRRREAYRRRLGALGAGVTFEDGPFRCRAVFPRVP